MRKLELASIVLGTLGGAAAIGIGFYQCVLAVVGGLGVKHEWQEPSPVSWKVILGATFYLLPTPCTLLGLFWMIRRKAVLLGSLFMLIGVAPTLVQIFIHSPLRSLDVFVLTTPALLCTSSVILHNIVVHNSKTRSRPEV
jgi:hypothetical protein